MAAAYLKNVEELRQKVEEFMDKLPPEQRGELAVDLGYIISKSVLCNPRKPQGTVRLNIVQGATQKYTVCRMTRETDPRTQREYNQLHISARNL